MLKFMRENYIYYGTLRMSPEGKKQIKKVTKILKKKKTDTAWLTC